MENKNLCIIKEPKDNLTVLSYADLHDTPPTTDFLGEPAHPRPWPNFKLVEI